MKVARGLRVQTRAVWHECEGVEANFQGLVVEGVQHLHSVEGLAHGAQTGVPGMGQIMSIRQLLVIYSPLKVLY